MIPSRTFATSGRAPAPGASANSTTATTRSRFIGRSVAPSTTFREGNLLVGRKVVDGEPAELGDVVRGSRLAGDDARVPVEVERRRVRVLGAAVAVGPRAREPERLDLDAGLLAQLAPQPVEWLFIHFQEAAGKIPLPRLGLELAPCEQNPAAFVGHERAHGGLGTCVGGEAALAACCGPAVVLERRGAARTVLPADDTHHARKNRAMSPRHVPATVTELTRCELLAELPGERLNELAKRMTREELPAGAAPVVEGEEGDRFYVVLSGVLAASKFGGRGAAGVLHPGAYFGEVSLAMGVPRTASVRAMTPAVVASCDKATFDEFIRPFFADDE